MLLVSYSDFTGKGAIMTYLSDVINKVTSNGRDVCPSDGQTVQRHQYQLTTPENIITYHNALCLTPNILHKHCLQFLLGAKMVPRETENNAYSKFWGDKQRAFWYVMVFSGVVN